MNTIDNNSELDRASKIADAISNTLYFEGYLQEDEAVTIYDILTDALVNRPDAVIALARLLERKL